jgi:hypothetical protein
MLSSSKLILSALLANSAAAIDPIATDVSVLDGYDRTGDLGIYRFGMFLDEGTTIRAYFPDELEYTGNILNDVEPCNYTDSEGTQEIDGCRYNPGSNSVEVPINVRPEGLLFFEIGGFKNPATAQTVGDFSVQVLGPLRGVRFQSTEMNSVEIKPNNLDYLSLSKVPGVVGASTGFTTDFMTTNELPVGGTVKISLQDETLQPPLEEPFELECATPSPGGLIMPLSCSYTTYESGNI